ncbi:MAG: hypothetical protein ACTHLY_07830, partial [Pseudolabrys sp.]
GTLKSNLRSRVFAQYVERHRAVWNEPAKAPHAGETPAVSAAPSGDAVATVTHPTPVAPSGRYDFPSAASIPPVSLMNPEPTQAEPKQGEAPPAAERKRPAPARRATNPTSGTAPR